MSATHQLFQEFNESKKIHGDHERLGQYFCNRYIKMSWPELFHEKNDAISIEIIKVWLADHDYHNELPPVLPSFLVRINS